MKKILTLFLAGISLNTFAISPELFDQSIRPVFLHLDCSKPYRLVVSIGGDGKTVEFDDGSVWVIKGSSQGEARRWAANDAVTIYPIVVNTWWHGAKYWIFNESTQSYVYADLSLGPIVNGECTNHVITLDLYRGEVLLRDARGYENLWQIDLKDLYKFRNWKIGDAVIIGSNESNRAQWYSPCKYILINVEENKYVCADILY